MWAKDAGAGLIIIIAQITELNQALLQLIDLITGIAALQIDLRYASARRRRGRLREWHRTLCRSSSIVHPIAVLIVIIKNIAGVSVISVGCASLRNLRSQAVECARSHHAHMADATRVVPGKDRGEAFI